MLLSVDLAWYSAAGIDQGAAEAHADLAAALDTATAMSSSPLLHTPAAAWGGLLVRWYVIGYCTAVTEIARAHAVLLDPELPA
ncbi:hypothetical protein ABUW04_00105 [Streptacidiphilus sp. N1-10]|uniref:Uncharacterized protein n=1 Tax=Streptacidiphilus jeojiensis TaxID=3229225 RepID=A0ABV6XEY5_9ACTN